MDNRILIGVYGPVNYQWILSIQRLTVIKWRYFVVQRQQEMGLDKRERILRPLQHLLNLGGPRYCNGDEIYETVERDVVIHETPCGFCNTKMNGQ